MKPNVQGVFWQFLARYCRPCKKLLTVKTSDTHFCVEFLKKNLWEVRSNFNVLRNIYHVPQIQQVRQVWEELHDDTEKWSKYVHEQKERALAVYNLSDECRTWVEGEAAAKGYRREEVRERRLQFIVAKLREMGWGEEIDMLPEDLFPLSDHPQVRMAREISERTWEKTRDEIVSYMQHNKDLRVAEKRCAVLRVRLQTLELVTKTLRAKVGRHENTEFLPKFPDYALMPEFRALMEAPTEEMLNMQAFADVAVRLRELDRPWVVQREKCLARMLEKALGRLPEDADDELPANDDPNDMSYEIILKLAVSTLECQRCSERFHATDATLHRCTRGSGRSWLLDIQHETEGSYTYEVARISRSLRPWDMSCLRVPDLEPLRRVIQMAGKDPETVTEEEMNKLNVRVAVKGQLVDGKRRFMTWDAVRRTGHLDPVVCESG